MVIKQGKIVEAYKALEALKDNDKFDEGSLWNLYKLRKTLLPYIEYQTEREKALQTKYAEFADANGTITGKPYLNFVNEMQSVIESEKELDWTPFEISLAPGLTLYTIEALDGFVTFKEPPSDK